MTSLLPRRDQRRIGGFTLLELLVAIAIIGILAAVVMPNLLQARRLASDRAAQSFARNVHNAAQAYLARDAANTLAAGTCTNGVPVGGAFGEFGVEDPGSLVTNCSWTEGGASVTVVYTGGTVPSISYP